MLDLSAASCCTAESTANVADRVGSVVGSESSDKQEETDYDRADNDETTLAGFGVAVFSPGTMSLASVLLDLLGSKLVVDETSKSNGVTKELKTGDGGLPDCHGSGNEKNILQDTAKGHDERRGLADL